MQIPETMTAVHLDKPGGPLIVRNIPVPRPGKGEVLIKVSASPVNPSDLARMKAVPEHEIKSFVPGIEGSGKVIMAGKGLLPRLWLGKRVAFSITHPTSGAWAEYMVTSAMRCFPIPESISDEQGAMLLVNPMTAIAFFDIVKRNKHKAIINTAAAGALGNMVLLLGKKYNTPVIHIVRNEQQVSKMKAQGGVYILNSTDADFTGQLSSLSHKLKATIAFDAVGGSFTQQLLEAVPYGSTVVEYGNISGSEQGVQLRPLIADNKKISGFYLENWAKDNGLIKTLRNISKVKQLLKNDVKITVQNRYPLHQAQHAIDTYLGNMTGGKVLLVPALIG